MIIVFLFCFFKCVLWVRLNYYYYSPFDDLMMIKIFSFDIINTCIRKYTIPMHSFFVECPSLFLFPSCWTIQIAIWFAINYLINKLSIWNRVSSLYFFAKLFWSRNFCSGLKNKKFDKKSFIIQFIWVVMNGDGDDLIFRLLMNQWKKNNVIVINLTSLNY